MIAEKLLACAAPEPLSNTLFLAFAQSPAGGAPDAIVGQLSGYAGIASDGIGGAIVQSGGYAYYTPVPAASLGAGDFLLDIVFDGENVPSVITPGSQYIRPCLPHRWSLGIFCLTLCSMAKISRRC